MTEHVSDKPVLPETPKRATEMTEAERAEALAAIKRGPPPKPMPVDRKAKDLTADERREWLAEYVRRTR
jgi:hypothetical protein